MTTLFFPLVLTASAAAVRLGTPVPAFAGAPVPAFAGAPLPSMGAFPLLPPLPPAAAAAHPARAHVESAKVGTWRATAAPRLSADGSKTQSFRSPALNLAPGHVINTPSDRTPIAMPPGSYAITAFAAEVVRANGTSVPLSEVYLHHWIIENGVGNAGPCDTLHFTFGIGAESRNTAWRMPAGYGFAVDGTEKWGGNIHAISTADYAVDNVKACIECVCPFGGGGVSCCPDGSVCPGAGERWRALNASGALTPTPYYLQYTVTWVESYRQAGIQPVQVLILDSTQCNVEYTIPQSCPWWIAHGYQGSLTGLSFPSDFFASDCPHLQSTEYKAAFDADLVWAVGHQHTGGINVTLSVNGRPAVASHPRYGNSTGVGPAAWEAGNEPGYLVAMEPADLSAAPVPLREGDALRVDGLYRGSPQFSGVMSYIMAYAVPTPTSRWGGCMIDDDDDAGDASATGGGGCFAFANGDSADACGSLAASGNSVTAKFVLDGTCRTVGPAGIFAGLYPANPVAGGGGTYYRGSCAKKGGNTIRLSANCDSECAHCEIDDVEVELGACFGNSTATPRFYHFNGKC
jgi:hypothetical protein